MNEQRKQEKCGCQGEKVIEGSPKEVDCDVMVNK
jgi:hypothetical protein